MATNHFEKFLGQNAGDIAIAIPPGEVIPPGLCFPKELLILEDKSGRGWTVADTVAGTRLDGLAWASPTALPTLNLRPLPSLSQQVQVGL